MLLCRSISDPPHSLSKCLLPLKYLTVLPQKNGNHGEENKAIRFKYVSERLITSATNETVTEFAARASEIRFSPLHDLFHCYWEEEIPFNFSHLPE